MRVPSGVGVCGYWVWGFGFGFCGLAFGVEVSGSEFRVEGSGFRVEGPAKQRING